MPRSLDIVDVAVLLTGLPRERVEAVAGPRPWRHFIDLTDVPGSDRPWPARLTTALASGTVHEQPQEQENTDMGLMDQLNAPDGEGWQPEPGDILLGTVVARGSVESQYGQGKRISVTVLPDDGSDAVRVVGYRNVLNQELEEADPQVGQHIGIKYSGKAKGRNYHLYKVAVEDVPTSGSAPAAPTTFQVGSGAAGSASVSADVYDDEPF